MIIEFVKAREILDSRSNPTLEVEIVLEDGSRGVFQVPSGASTGIHEALELRDHDETRFHGKGVLKAVQHVSLVAEKLIGNDYTQESLDTFLLELDGTKNKEMLGANAILGISVAFAKASAKYYNLPLHEYLYRLLHGISFTNKKRHNIVEIHPFANVINGGLHSGNNLQVQEFMLVPLVSSFSEKTRAICETYQELKTLISKNYSSSSTSLGDEGGFAPEINSPKEALDLLVEAVNNAGYTGKMVFALDAAASDFYNAKTKKYEIEKGKLLDYKQLTEYYLDLVSSYPLVSIEDPMAEDDFEGFSYYMETFSSIKKINPITKKKQQLVVGDDLLVTNVERIQLAIEKKLCNSLLLKINQIGTLTESLNAYRLAHSSGWHVIVSHRSGETTDDFIADLAIALESSIKLGAPARGERVAKYNRLLKIYS
jgi:enolase